MCASNAVVAGAPLSSTHVQLVSTFVPEAARIW